MAQNSVLVIGAGMAGLTAAWELAGAGWQVVVLEARERMGGRVHTLRPAGQGPPIEVGAEFIHGENVSTWAFIRRAGLATHKVPDRQWHRVNGQLAEDESFSRELRHLTERREGPDQSVAEFLRQGPGLSSETREALREYVEGFHAADAARISAQAVATAERAAEEVEGERAFRISQGYSALLDWFAAELSARGVSVRLGTVVQRLEWNPDQVRARAMGDGKEHVFTAPRVLITLPPAVLRGSGPGAIEFVPELPPEKRRTFDLLESGSVTKVVLQFRRQFWPVPNFGFIHWPDEWLPTWWADERGLILTGWAGGPRAERLNSQQPAFLHRQASRALAEIFNVGEAEVDDNLENLHACNWTQEPFSRGAYSYIVVGGIDAPQRLAEPLDGTLFFAGEATAANGQQGTVHGAISSGQRAAREILGKS